MSLTCHSNCNYLCFSVFRPPLQHFKIARKVEKNRLKLAFQAVLLWLPKKDSNPHKQSQSLSCYPYTIRQYSRSKPVGFKRCFMVAEEGFEPSQTESESVVLPLHNSAICFCCFVNQRVLLYAITRVLSTKTLKIFMKILYKENRNFDDIGSRKSTRQGV